jgi:hypothetical protein
MQSGSATRKTTTDASASVRTPRRTRRGAEQGWRAYDGVKAAGGCGSGPPVGAVRGRPSGRAVSYGSRRGGAVRCRRR